MKVVSFFALFLAKLLLVLPLCWWAVMTGFGAWRCLELSPGGGGCAALIILAPFIAAFPIGDGENSWAFTLTALAVPTIAFLVVLAWQFGLPYWRRSRYRTNRK